MRLRRVLSFLGCAGLIATVGMAAASVGDTACFRAELDAFLTDFKYLPNFNPADIEATRRAMAEAPPETLLFLQGELTQIRNWQQLPAVLASLGAAQEQFRREELARFAAEAMASPQLEIRERNPEDTRRALMYTVAQLRALEPLIGSEHDARLAEAQMQIATLDPESLMRINAVVTEQMSGFKEQLSRLASREPGSTGPLSAVIAPMDGACGDKCDWDLTGACHSICHAVSDAIQATLNALRAAVTSFLDAVTGPITNIFNAVISLPNAIANEFNALLSRVQSFFTGAINSLVALIPTSPEEVFNAIIPAAAKSIDALAAAINSLPTIPDLCPGDAVLDIAEDVCERGAGRLTNLFVKLAPGDTVGLVAKVPLVLLDSGVNYFCMCVDHRDATEFDTAQAAHRQLTRNMLDDKLSVLATQVSVNALNTSLVGLDSDVQKVEAKLDELGKDASNLEQALKEEYEFLKKFKELLVRINVEENLLQNKPDVVSLFQLPENFGGHLGLVRSIAHNTFEMNEAAGQKTNGAFRELGRADSLFSVGDFVKAYEAYRSAYTEAVK